MEIFFLWPGFIFSVVKTRQSSRAHWGGRHPPLHIWSDAPRQGRHPCWSGTTLWVARDRNLTQSLLSKKQVIYWSGTRMAHGTEGNPEHNQVCAGTSGVRSRASPLPGLPCFSHWVGLILSGCGQVPTHHRRWPCRVTLWPERNQLWFEKS